VTPRKLSTLLALLAALSWVGCAGGIALGRPRRPPMPPDPAIDELELVCSPDPDPKVPGCRPTRITVEVCESDLDAGCTTRRGLHDFLSELDAYDCYVAKLRGEVEPACEEPEE